MLLPAYPTRDVIISFEAMNGSNNDMYLDDIRIDGQPLALQPSLASASKAWPNPVSRGSALMLELPASTTPTTVRLMDALGREASAGVIPASSEARRQSLTVPGAAGLYVLHYMGVDGSSHTERIVVE